MRDFLAFLLKMLFDQRGEVGADDDDGDDDHNDDQDDDLDDDSSDDDEDDDVDLGLDDDDSDDDDSKEASMGLTGPNEMDIELTSSMDDLLTPDAEADAQLAGLFADPQALEALRASESDVAD